LQDRQELVEKSVICKYLLRLQRRIILRNVERMVDQQRRQFGNGGGQRLPQRVLSCLLCLLARCLRLRLLAIDSLLQTLANALLGELGNASIVLSQGQVVLQPNSELLMLFALLDIAQQRKDIQVAIGEDDVATSVELEVESVQAVGELELENAVGADLRDGGDSAGL
jgi:hypothetical protein